MRNGFAPLNIYVAPTPLFSFNFGVLKLFLESCGDGPYQLSTLGAWGSAWGVHASLKGRTRPSLIGLRGALPLSFRPAARALNTLVMDPPELHGLGRVATRSTSAPLGLIPSLSGATGVLDPGGRPAFSGRRVSPLRSLSPRAAEAARGEAQSCGFRTS